MENKIIEVINAKRVLKEYCESIIGCNGCVYNDGYGECILNTYPDEWPDTDFKQLITPFEVEFFKHLNPKFKWIAKDSDGCVYMYADKPLKEERCWEREYGVRCNMVSTIFNDDIFKWLSWEDKEPCYIPYLIEECE